MDVDDRARDCVARVGRPTPSASPCSPAPASRPTPASPTSAARTACGRRTRRPRRWRRSSTTSPTPTCGRPPGAAATRTRRSTPEPNAGHEAIVELARQGKLHAVVTQNVDGLHQKAGLADELVVEVHGTIWWTRCWDVPGPPSDGRDARPGRGRRGGSAVRGVRRHPQERHHLVRPGADPRGHRPGDGGQRGVRPAARRRLDAVASTRPPTACRGPSRRAPRSSSSTAGRPRWTASPTPSCRARSARSCRDSSDDDTRPLSVRAAESWPL